MSASDSPGSPSGRRRLAIIGASGHGRVILDAGLKAGSWEIVGFIDDGLAKGTRVSGFPVLGGIAEVATMVGENRLDGLIVALGDNATRRRCVGQISALWPAVRFITIIHPGAVVGSDVVIGDGTAVLAGVIVGVGCTIGAHCILNTGSQLDHDSIMGDFAALGPGAITGGNIRIGAGSWLGLGAKAIQGIAIGGETVVGAGAVVVEDLPGNVVALGVPARVTGRRENGDRYL